MKSVVFVIRTLTNGGVEHSFIRLINELKDYEITVVFAEDDKTLLPLIKNKAAYVYLTDKGMGIRDKVYLTQSFKNKKPYLFLKASFLTAHARITKNTDLLTKFLLRPYKIEEKEFDLAIAYDGGTKSTTPFVVEKIKAAKKVMWVHEDYTKLSPSEKKEGHKLFLHFDQIFCVSQGAKERFDEVYPELKAKTDVFYSIFNSQEFIQKAQQSVSDFQYEGTKILTVGRLSEEKGQEFLPEAAAKLKKSGYRFKWFLIGEGRIKGKLEKQIKKHGVEDSLILLGAKENPYPYYKECDIYVQPSKHEGYCLTMAEAISFGKPVVATNFLTAKEFITHGKDGLITEMNATAIYETIKQVLDNPDLKLQLTRNCEKKSFNTVTEMQKFYAL
ncbi:MAG: glycosyltransferase [Carnobacterium sp.]|uniref:glycosyltransferase n=1 Tax=Carnobacterium sp. TaxID=48221 RepID=UPI002FCBF647